MTNAIERLKELVRLGEDCDCGPWEYCPANRSEPRGNYRNLVRTQCKVIGHPFSDSEDEARFWVAAANARPDLAKLLEVVEAASKRVHELDPLRAVIEIAERDGNLKALNPEVLARRLISEFEYQDAIRAALRNLETKETSDA